MVEERNFHEELGECTCLDIVIVGLGDTSDPRVRRAVGRDLEIESLENDPFTLEDLFLVVPLFSHEDELVDTASQLESSKQQLTYLGARISSYLAAINMAVTPTSCSLMRDTTRTDRNRSTMLMAIHRVSGSMWYRKWTCSNQSINVVLIVLFISYTHEER
jgi:hypothetical protein